MTSPQLTFDARYLKILAGGVLEQRIVQVARILATERQSRLIEPADVRAAITQVFREDLSHLSQIVEERMAKYPAPMKSAA